MSWLHYHSMLALHDHPVLAMVNILALKLYQLFQYSYGCSSVMSVHSEVEAPREVLEYRLLM